MAEQRGNYFSYQKRVTTSNSLDRNRFLFSKSSTDLQAITCVVCALNMMIPFFLKFSGNLLCSLALSEHASSVMDVYKQLVPKVMQTDRSYWCQRMKVRIKLHSLFVLFHGRLGLLSKCLCEHCRYSFFAVLMLKRIN